MNTVGHSSEALDFCYQTLGAERLLFGTDQPFGDFRSAAAMVEGLACSDAERDLIYYRNAVKLPALS